jgi:glucosamine--fructose-6-phosphate aminotransferase (isomerizing)
VACGTSGLAEYVFEEFSRIPVEVEYASEFRYRNPIINSNDVVIAISQSGETADTMAAIKLAKERGALFFLGCTCGFFYIERKSCRCVYTCRS